MSEFFSYFKKVIHIEKKNFFEKFKILKTYFFKSFGFNI
jgi:hypothetical protein